MGHCGARKVSDQLIYPVALKRCVRFRSFVPMYFRDAMAAVVVYDITDRDSFESTKNWVQMVNIL